MSVAGEGWEDLPAGAEDIGNGVFISRVTHDGVWVGINEWHLNNAGKLCGGWIPFKGTHLTTPFSWDVLSKDPLTLAPSLQCRACGNHGFIRNGRWVPV
jgi:hypothetical protein